MIRAIPEVPFGVETRLRDFLTAVREQLVRIQTARAPANPITDLRADPLPGGIAVQFSRSDADSYILYWSADQQFANSHAIEIGRANRWADIFGKSAISRWYWVKSKRVGGDDSALVGPVTATSLGLAVEATIPPAPPDTVTPATSRETGNQVIYHPAGVKGKVV